MKDFPPNVPRLDPVPFIAASGVLLACAGFIAWQGEHPLGVGTLAAFSSLVGLSCLISLWPFVVNHTRRQEESLLERTRQIEALAQSVATSAEQISIAATNLPAIATNSLGLLEIASAMPADLQARLATVQVQISAVAAEENAALRRELDALRSADSTRLSAALEGLSRATAELARLESLQVRHSAALDSALAQLPRSMERAVQQSGDLLRQENALALAALQANAASVANTLAATADEARAAFDQSLRDAIDQLATQISAIPSPVAVTPAKTEPEPETIRNDGRTPGISENVTVPEQAPELVSEPATEPEPEPEPANELEPEPEPEPAAPDSSTAEVTAEPLPEETQTEQPRPVSEPLIETPAAAPTDEETQAFAHEPEAPENTGLAREIQEDDTTSEPMPELAAEPPPEPVPVPEPEPTPEPAWADLSTPETTVEPLGESISTGTGAVSESPVESPIATPAATPAMEKPAIQADAAAPVPVEEAQPPEPEPASAPEPEPAELTPEPEPEATQEPEPEPTPEPESAEPEQSEPEPQEPALSHDGYTRLVATAFIGIGNKLFVRGDGPGLRRDKGTALQFVSIGKWQWESAELLFPAKVRLYKNDQIECTALGEITLEPGHHHEVSATF